MKKIKYLCKNGMIDAVFYEVFAEEKKALKKFLSPSIRARFISKTIQECVEVFPPAKLISIRTQSRVPLRWASHLAGIFTRSQGYDHLVSYRRASGRDIPCGYIREYCSRAVAEQAVLMMMVLLRKLKKQMDCFGAFSRDGLTGAGCRGRRALVIGIGRIGTEIVTICRGLGMTVKGVDPRHGLKGFDYVPLAKGLSWADVVLCACPLTAKTKGMLNYNMLRRVKRGTIFVNVGRGEVSPTEDLARLLSEDALGGIGLDVFDGEYLLADFLRARRANSSVRRIRKLKDKSNVVFTPHNAFNTQEALEEKARLSAEAVERFLRQGAFPNAVMES
ncbi:MAG: hydroxyacid dehydrogenase [Candidatus Omnitrophica bacterium]|nr:hydroxyacid dehydrogenase [Candidatus Omnitrophota bacterium]